MPVLANARYERYAQELAKGTAQHKAFEAAGFKANTGNAVRLRNRPEVKARIAEILGKAAEKTGITKERVLAELGKIGFADIRKMFTEHGSIRRIEELDDDAAAALSSVEVVRRRVPGTDRDDPEYEDVTKFRMHDKRAALVDIGKHLGMFVDKHAITDTEGNDLDMGDTDLARLIVFQLTKAAKG